MFYLRDMQSKSPKAPAPLPSPPRSKLRDGLRGKKVMGIVTGDNIPLEPIRDPRNGTMEHN